MNIKKCTFAVIIINSKLIKQYHHENSKQHDLKRQFLHLEAAINYLIMAIGALFAIPGIISIFSYLSRRGSGPEANPIFPVDAAGSILLGAWLMIMPSFFVNILMYILGGLLVLAYINVYIRRTLGLGGGTTNHSAYHGPEMGGRSIRLLPVTDPDPRHRRDDLALPV